MIREALSAVIYLKFSFCGL